jgi:hypothetical protein
MNWYELEISLSPRFMIFVCVSKFLGTFFEHAILMVSPWWRSFRSIKGPVTIWQGRLPISSLNVTHRMNGAATDFMNLTCVTSRIFRIRYPVMFQMLRKLPMASMCLRNSYWLMLLGVLSQLRFFIQGHNCSRGPEDLRNMYSVLAVLATSQFKPVLDIYRWLSQLHHADR